MVNHTTGSQRYNARMDKIWENSLRLKGIELDKRLRKLKTAYNKDEDSADEILEKIEEDYHADLTHFYGEDYSNPTTIRKLKKELEKHQ